MKKKINQKEVQKAKELWEYKTKKLGYRSPGFRILSLYHPEFIQKYLKPSKDKVLFEIGCGWGKQTKLFSPMFKTVIAEDVSPTILNIAKEEMKEFNNIIYCEYPQDIEKIPKFDCLFSYGTMQAMTDNVILDTLYKISPYMKSNGKFLLEFQTFHAPQKIQKFVSDKMISVMRNVKEVAIILKQTDLIMTGYKLVTSPALQVWTYGFKK